MDHAEADEGSAVAGVKYLDPSRFVTASSNGALRMWGGGQQQGAGFAADRFGSRRFSPTAGAERGFGGAAGALLALAVAPAIGVAAAADDFGVVRFFTAHTA
jgi:hypothetical protein